MNMEVGVRVVRGPNWSWEDQDGGEGSVGTVIEVNSPESTCEGEEHVIVHVCWDVGVLSNYRCGFGGQNGVIVYDSAQTGVSHPAVMCDGCSTSPVYGMRWKCATCYDYDLCTECYMSNKHSLEHRFLRCDTPERARVPVPARSGGRRVKAKGFFKGAVVSRGKDWSWDDQDGGVGSTGVVKVIKGWRDESYRSIAEVEWGTSGSSNVYRVGHKGKVDLKCDTPGDGGEYYPDHLPMSDASSSTSQDTDKPVMLMSGDKVKVSVNSQQFREQQEDHGGWNGLMNQLLGKTGAVHAVLANGDVRFDDGKRVWTINPTSLVRVTDGREVAQRVTGSDSIPSQTHPSMEKHVENSTTSDFPSLVASETEKTHTAISASNGSTSTPSTLTASTSSSSTNMASTSTFSTQRLKFAPTTVSMTTASSAAVTVVQDSLDTQTTTNGTSEHHEFKDGDVVRVIDDLSKVRQLQEGHGGWLDLMALCLGELGKINRVLPNGRCEVLFRRFRWVMNQKALIPTPGENPPPFQGLQALQDTLHLPSSLQRFVDLGGTGHGLLGDMHLGMDHWRDFLTRDGGEADADSPLHTAVKGCDTDTIQQLLDNSANVDSQNARGCTPLFVACHTSNVRAVEMLLAAGADPSISNKGDMNSFHISCREGFLSICELILKRQPNLLNVRRPNGYGPLHLASLNGRYSVVKFLLSHEQCDVDAITYEGHTALHSAVAHGHYAIAELLIGYGIDLDATESNGCSALHLVLGVPGVEVQTVTTVPKSPELKKICASLSNLSSSMLGKASLACLLVREGANLHLEADDSRDRMTPLQLCPEELTPHLTQFARERATFHGSLRKFPKPTPADLVEEEDTPKPQKTVEESSKAHRELLNQGFKSVLLKQLTTPTDRLICKTTTNLPCDDDEACLLCDEPVDVRIEPCGHTVLCRSHANTAKRCPQCRGPIHSIADLEPLCGMCQENVCSVTLKPCDHMMCSGCALRMKCCFECKTKITSKEGLQDSSQSTAVKSESDPTSITTTDSSVSISDESFLCEICVSNKKNTAFTCGHQLCYDCSLKVDKCPVCREEIKFRVRLH